MKLINTILLTLALVLGISAYSQNNISEKMKSFAKQYIQDQTTMKITISSEENLFISEEKGTQVVAYQLNPQGFLVIDENLEVLAYSFKNDMAAMGTPERDITLDFLKYIASINFETENNSKAEDEMWGPYVYNMWGQVNCSDNSGSTINVNNLFTPNHYAPGCVAVSQSTILKHYSWPPRGMGVSSYTDNSGSNTGTYTVNLEEFEYDWDHALDRYRNKASEVYEREAAGYPTYHSAVSVSMDFEYNGSTSNVNRIPYALANYFRFTSLYKSRSTSSFWSILDSNMVWKKPVVLAVENSAGGGHSVVCDGLKIEDGDYSYHLNMGWWGTSNGWYNIRSTFDAGGYNYVIGATMNIIPEPYFEIPTVLDNAALTQLSWSYPENGFAEAYEIQRSINGGSWETITNTITDTTLTIFPTEGNSYEFRGRAMVNNARWYTNSWSDVVTLVWLYTGINEKTLDQVKFYPNPVQNELSIEIPFANKAINIRVFSEIGQEIYHETAKQSTKLNINTYSWEKGVYLIQIWNDESSKTFKSIKL